MPDQSVRRAALATLFILQAVMLGALYAGVPPHPPQAIPLFAMAPFLGAALGLCAAAYLLADQSRTGGVLAALAALAALVSFGPQKYVDPAFPMIWPAVVTAQAACAVLLAGVLRRARPLPVS
jgi:4-amino-4-deoxy-L-arabinose transferase-like glycosyltransferase